MEKNIFEMSFGGWAWFVSVFFCFSLAFEAGFLCVALSVLVLELTF